MTVADRRELIEEVTVQPRLRTHWAKERPQPRALRTMLSDHQLAARGLVIETSAASRFVRADALARTMREPGSQWLVEQPANDHTTAAPPAWQQEVEARLNELEEDARAEDLPFSTSSATAARAFLQRHGGEQRPSLFLLGNGNLRLLWLNERDEQVGLQFRGDEDVQIVLFEQVAGRLDYSASQRSADDVMTFITRNGLARLLA